MGKERIKEAFCIFNNRILISSFNLLQSTFLNSSFLTSILRRKAISNLLHNNTPEPPTPAASIAIDRSALYHPPEHSHEPSADSELVKHLKNVIKFRGGPITVSEYMEEVLTNPKAVFYMNRDVFGSDGDFITSPEVSQMFGEIVSFSTRM